MFRIIFDDGHFKAITMAGNIAASSSAYTDMGDLPITGEPKLVSNKNGYILYDVKVPVYVDAQEATPSKFITLRASLPTGVMNPKGVKWYVSLVDKPYAIGQNTGITYAGKVRFELVETVGLPPSAEQVSKATVLMTSYLERQKTGFKA